MKGTGKIVAIGKKGGEYKIVKDDWTDFTKKFLDSFKDELGPSAGDIIAEDHDTIREQRQRLIESENQLKQTEDIIAKRKQEKLEVKDLQEKIGQINACIDALQSDYGFNLENEAEIRRLKQLKNNYQIELKNKNKILSNLEKEVKKEKKNK